MKPQRIQLSRARGFNLQRASRELNGLPAISVARPHMYGNPYRVGDLGIPDAATAVRKFRKLTRRPQSVLRADNRYFMFARNRVRVYLKNMNLACWCPLPKPGEPDICHAAVLIWIANK